MAVTIKEIAAAAGVSIATVSKVINNKLYVSEATRQRVLDVMAQYHYAPNASAANLARQSSRRILYADHFYKGLPYENPHMFDIICGASAELSRKGYQLSLLNLESKEQSPREILEEAILSKSADGIIVNGFFVTPEIEQLFLRYDFPQICIGAPNFDSILSWIDTNHMLSSSLAVEHLLNRNRLNIAFMGGQPEEKIFMDRLRGFRVAMKKHNLPVREEFVVYSDPRIEDIIDAAKKLLSLPQPPDGVICTNSLVAVGTVRAADELGIAIPRELALIAFDDYPYSPILLPPPTVINIDLYHLGSHAGNLIVKKIKNPAMLTQTYTALPKLIRRETT